MNQVLDIDEKTNRIDIFDVNEQSVTVVIR